MKRIHSLLLLTAALTLVCGCQSAPKSLRNLFASSQPDADDPLADISSEDISEDYRNAQKELNHTEETLLKFARWREDIGDFPEARRQYVNILADNKKCVDARLGIARVEFATGRVAEAVAILEATARRFPDHAQTWAELGRIQSNRNEWGAAVQSLTKAAELDPQNQEIRFELGVALARSERIDDALTHLEFAVGESAALYNIGYVLYEEGRTEEAGHWFRRALNAHPDQRTARASAQMLAQMSGESGFSPATRQPGRVDVATTSFESWRETPGDPTAQQPSHTATGRQPAAPVSRPAQSVNASPIPGNWAQRGVTSTASLSRPYPAAEAAPAAPSAGGVPQWQGPAGRVAIPSTQPGQSAGPITPQQWNGPRQ